MIYWARRYFSDPRNHLEAIYEVLVTASFSLIPFAITYIVRSATLTEGDFVQLDQIFGRGQIFLIAYSVYGSVFWLAFVRGDRPRHGARVFFGVLATLMIFPVVGFIGFDPTFSTVLNPTLVEYSYWFYGILLFFNYLVLFYMNVSPPEPSNIFDSGARNMRDAYRERRTDG